jgi:transcriptional regulator with XRE-family HTH domain
VQRARGVAVVSMLAGIYCNQSAIILGYRVLASGRDRLGLGGTRHVERGICMHEEREGHDAQRRAELAHFLRTCRERLSPADVGLPDGGRRRTPGLRREELAQLANVGVSWYTWLEQGRSITVSSQVLDSLAQALRLDATARTHLFILARQEVPALATSAAVTERVGPAVRQILDALGAFPACLPALVTNARWDAVAWNEVARRVFMDFAALPARDRNLLRFMFAHPQPRQLYEDWEGAAQRLLATFRASTGRYVGEAWLMDLIAEVSGASPEFAAWWALGDVRGTPEGSKAICHPRVGRLELQLTLLQVAETPDLWMTVYTPAAETATAARLQRLMAGSLADVGEGDT